MARPLPEDVSEYLAASLARDPSLRDSLLECGPHWQVRRARAARAVATAPDTAAAMKSLREWRRREMTRIIARDVAGSSSVIETIEELSDFADAAIRAAAGYAERELAPVFGLPLGADGERPMLIVVGMGKLGGRELNFSSDIDLVFAYSDAGETSGPRVIDNGEYFHRLGQALLRLLNERTEDGFVFRVDMRLRPFGDSGPLVPSLAALEDYFQQHGRDWERYAWIKARAIVGSEVYANFYRDCVRPFVYRRYLDFGVFEALRDMKALIVREVSRRDLTDHIKLGRGGIREIEFIVQSFQLIRGGSDRRLQNASLLAVLPLLAGSKLLREQTVAELRGAYLTLRKAENVLQMIRDEQTHLLPQSTADQARLAAGMGCPGWPEALAQIEQARELTAAHFEGLLFAGRNGAAAREDTSARWFVDEGPTLVQELRRVGMPESEVDPAAQALVAYRSSSAYRRLDEVARKRVHQVLEKILQHAKQRPAAAITIERALRVLEAIGMRSAYLALLNENASALTRLVDVCAVSGFLTRQIAAYPLLLDELVDTRLFEELPSRDGFVNELAARTERMPSDEPDRQVEALRQFQNAAVFAVALADVTGKLPLMKVSDRLTDIAELIVDRCLQLAWQQMTAVYGSPRCGADASTARPVEVAVIGYGKLGGLELGYGSDLDLVFLHDSAGEWQQTDGEAPVDNGVFFLRLAQRIIHLLTMHSNAGTLYEVDMRLRPNGKGGFLITGIDAFERYQRTDAWTWEHQALLRARAVAGSQLLCERFETVRRDVLCHGVRCDSLRQDVAQMRERMRNELAKSKEGYFDVKQAPGGIADIEFLVQYLVLANASSHPPLLTYTDNIRQLEGLAAVGVLDAATARALMDAYRGYRAIVHHASLEHEDARLTPAAEHAATRSKVLAIWNKTFGILPADSS
jgi:[glutamine synthetase] adenylyltransferase / [glutamine synthetase]-adenylyl-L-tyrosine phosphorylase